MVSSQDAYDEVLEELTYDLQQARIKYKKAEEDKTVHLSKLKFINQEIEECKEKILMLESRIDRHNIKDYNQHDNKRQSI